MFELFAAFVLLTLVLVLVVTLLALSAHLVLEVVRTWMVLRAAIKKARHE